MSAYPPAGAGGPPMRNLLALDLVCGRWFAKVPSPQGRRAEPDV
jgi:hypothetical protein